MNGFQVAVRILIICYPWPLKLTPCWMNHTGSANQPYLIRPKPHLALVISELWKPCFQEITNHEFFSLQFSFLYLLWMYLEDQDCLSRRKWTKRFTDSTFLHTHALCLIFKCASQENISARGQALFFEKGKFEIFKLISHSNKDRKKKRKCYTRLRMSLFSCTTYPKNVHFLARSQDFSSSG